jgi:hypothetical protein
VLEVARGLNAGEVAAAVGKSLLTVRRWRRARRSGYALVLFADQSIKGRSPYAAANAQQRKRQSGLGHEGRFSPPRLSARSVIRKRTVASIRGNGQDAPKAVAGTRVDLRNPKFDMASRSAAVPRLTREVPQRRRYGCRCCRVFARATAGSTTRAIAPASGRHKQSGRRDSR